MPSSAFEEALAQLDKLGTFPGVRDRQALPVRDDGSITTFFYGALGHAATLKLLINGEIENLELCPAILPGYTRHHVKHASYPGIIPCEESARIIGREIASDEKCVFGIIVRGLTVRQIRLLDNFEGNDYRHAYLSAHPLKDSSPFDAALADEKKALAYEVSLKDVLPAERVLTYVWDAPVHELEPQLCSCEVFEEGRSQGKTDQ